MPRIWQRTASSHTTPLQSSTSPHAAPSRDAHQPSSTHHALMRRALPTNGVFANFRKKLRLLETLSPLTRCSKTFEKRMKASGKRHCTVSPVQYDSELRIFLFSARVKVAQSRLRETNAPTNVKMPRFGKKSVCWQMPTEENATKRRSRPGALTDGRQHPRLGAAHETQRAKQKAKPRSRTQRTKRSATQWGGKTPHQNVTCETERDATGRQHPP